MLIIFSGLDPIQADSLLPEIKEALANVIKEPHKSQLQIRIDAKKKDRPCVTLFVPPGTDIEEAERQLNFLHTEKVSYDVRRIFGGGR